MNMKLTNIKNIDSIEKGIKLLNMRNNEVVIIEDIKDNTIKIKGKDRYNSLSTVKRWYKVIVSTESETTESETTESETTESETTESETTESETTESETTESETTESETMEVKHPHRKVKRNREVNCNISPVYDVTLIRDELLTYCRGIGSLKERVASKYNSFYLNKVNLFEVMSGKKSFIIYFNDKYLNEELRGHLVQNLKVRGNNQVLKVIDRNTFKVARFIIKSIVESKQ